MNTFEQELIQHRRTLHQIPEVGFALEQTANYIFNTLVAYGITPKWVGQYGIIAVVGHQSQPCVLLRADMDALPMEELSQETFASTNGCMHSCGHDFHMSMLLGAAKRLKANEDQLLGCVKLMFQPNEEGVKGAKEMIAQGILQHPKVDAAFALHVESANAPTSTLQYCYGPITAASDILEFKIFGVSAHGAMPHTGIDVIHVGVQLYQALQNIIARELDAFHPTVLTLGQFNAGSAHNILPETCYLKGSLRTFDLQDRKLILERIQTIVNGLASAFQVRIDFNIVESVDSIRNDPSIIDLIKRHQGTYPLQERLHPWIVSEDFCWIANEVPSAFLTLSAGSIEEGYPFPLHNARVRFNEQCLVTGANFLYDMAIAYLQEHAST